MAIYTKEALLSQGFKSVGLAPKISSKASFYGCEHISLGDNVRIDDFCVLSAGDGGIDIGDYIHIAVYSSIIGKANVTLNNFCNISSRVSIYSSNDDYSGDYMTNPMVPIEYTNVKHEAVIIGKHSIIGSGSVILPGCDIGEGAAVGAFSLVNKPLTDWGVYVGQPVKWVKQRKNELLKHETALLTSLAAN